MLSLMLQGFMILEFEICNRMLSQALGPFSASADEMATDFLDSRAHLECNVPETGSSGTQTITDPTTGDDRLIIRLTKEGK
jgi:hypothetical protein